MRILRAESEHNEAMLTGIGKRVSRLLANVDRD